MVLAGGRKSDSAPWTKADLRRVFAIVHPPPARPFSDVRDRCSIKFFGRVAIVSSRMQTTVPFTFRTIV
jgi:hypothetical protein